MAKRSTHKACPLGMGNSKFRMLAAMAVLLGFCIGAASADLAAPEQSRKLLQGNLTDVAQRLCTTQGFAAQQCALADEPEETSTTTCLHCGTMYRLLPRELPAELTGHHSYYQIGVKILSLTCKGPVVVRSVFKMHAGDNFTDADLNCTNAGLDAMGSQVGVVIRCELQLPATGGSEVQRALRSKEVKCWQCGRCSKGKGCPNRYGVWYSDTFTTVAKGCDLTPGGEYEAHKVGFVINPRTKVLLAKFEACNNPGCFDPAYEQAKQKTAGPCVNGTCTE